MNDRTDIYRKALELEAALADMTRQRDEWRQQAGADGHRIYSENGLLAQLAEARARLTDLVVWAEWMKKRHRTPEMGQPNTGALGAAQAFLATRPAPAECTCGADAQRKHGLTPAHLPSCERADPRPAPAECHCYDDPFIHPPNAEGETLHYRDCPRADPRPVPAECPECGCSPECLKHHGKHEERCSRRADPRPAPTTD